MIAPLTEVPDDADDADDAAGVVEYRNLRRASAFFPGRPHWSTLHRWASKGVKRNGRVIFLRTIVSGGRRLTTKEWSEFVAACNADERPVTRTPAQRQRQHEATMKCLADMGVKID